MVLIPFTLLDRILYRGTHRRVLLDQISHPVRVTLYSLRFMCYEDIYRMRMDAMKYLHFLNSYLDHGRMDFGHGHVVLYKVSVWHNGEIPLSLK
jgi:hypothetical protein